MLSEEQKSSLAELILKIFHMYGIFQLTIDKIVYPYGLTSSRWQVVHAVVEHPGTVASIARKMGLSRQSVLRNVGILEAGGFVKLSPNPGHKRASLVSVTQKGKEIYDQVESQRIVWIDKVAKHLFESDLQGTEKFIDVISAQLIKDLNENYYQS